MGNFRVSKLERLTVDGQVRFIGYRPTEARLWERWDDRRPRSTSGGKTGPSASALGKQSQYHDSRDKPLEFTNPLDSSKEPLLAPRFPEWSCRPGDAAPHFSFHAGLLAERSAILAGIQQKRTFLDPRKVRPPPPRSGWCPHVGWSIGVLASLNGPENSRKIESEAPVFQIVQIEENSLCEIRVTPQPVDLSPSRYSRLDEVS